MNILIGMRKSVWCINWREKFTYFKNVSFYLEQIKKRKRVLLSGIKGVLLITRSKLWTNVNYAYEWSHEFCLLIYINPILLKYWNSLRFNFVFTLFILQMVNPILIKLKFPIHHTSIPIPKFSSNSFEQMVWLNMHSSILK